MKTREIARFGLLSAAALVLGYIESIIPFAPHIPGIKLGIANTVLLYALYISGAGGASLLMLVKVFLSGFLYAGVSGLLYSLAGGVLSLSAMIAVKRIRGVSTVGVSVTGACFHNIGQLIVAALIVGARAAVSLVPPLIVAAIIAGIATGVAAKYVIKGLENAGKK